MTCLRQNRATANLLFLSGQARPYTKIGIHVHINKSNTTSSVAILPTLPNIAFSSFGLLFCAMTPLVSYIAHKIFSEMAYYVSDWTLNPFSHIHTFTCSSELTSAAISLTLKLINFFYPFLCYYVINVCSCFNSHSSIVFQTGAYHPYLICSINQYMYNIHIYDILYHHHHHHHQILFYCANKI